MNQSKLCVSYHIIRDTLVLSDHVNALHRPPVDSAFDGHNVGAGDRVNNV